jgi:hypothetical protein
MSSKATKREPGDARPKTLLCKKLLLRNPKKLKPDVPGRIFWGRLWLRIGLFCQWWWYQLIRKYVSNLSPSLLAARKCLICLHLCLQHATTVTSFLRPKKNKLSWSITTFRRTQGRVDLRLNSATCSQTDTRSVLLQTATLQSWQDRISTLLETNTGSFLEHAAVDHELTGRDVSTGGTSDFSAWNCARKNSSYFPMYTLLQ